MARISRTVAAEFRRQIGIEIAADVALAYTVGEAVEVHAFGYWYRGTVEKLGRKLVHVRYASGTGTVRVKAVGFDKIRKVLA